jgi:hypothetical protein
MKKIIAAVTATLICVVAADYFGLFGVKQVDMADLLHLRVKPVDQETGQIITDVHVTCVRRKSEEACSQKQQAGDGVLTLNFLVNRSAKYSRLLRFKTAEKLWVDDDTIVVLVFIHPNYDRLFLQVTTPDILQWGESVKVIELAPAGGAGGAAS